MSTSPRRCLFTGCRGFISSVVIFFFPPSRHHCVLLKSFKCIHSIRSRLTTFTRCRLPNASFQRRTRRTDVYLVFFSTCYGCGWETRHREGCGCDVARECVSDRLYVVQSRSLSKRPCDSDEPPTHVHSCSRLNSDHLCPR